MMTTRLMLALLVAALMLAGCGSQTTGSGSATSAAGEAAALPGEKGGTEVAVVPGSHEDWCDEHGVPESACTRCDPSLIPAFKAVNDWDEAHGLPLSQCLVHDPNLKITRPPAPGGK